MNKTIPIDTNLQHKASYIKAQIRGCRISHYAPDLQIKEFAVRAAPRQTNLFPDLEYEFGAQTHHNGLTISSFTNYIKNTWIPANLPDDVSSISSERINIL